MPREVVGNIPEFSGETPPAEPGKEEVKEAPAEKVEEKEKETPSELPAEEKPAEEVPVEEKPSVDTEELAKQVQGLQETKDQILKDIQELRGTRREIKKEELKVTEKKIDELKDLHPEDIAVIERITKAKGYTTKEEVSKMFYDTVKNDELNKFLEKYPEYKPENDPSDVNWKKLQAELGFYRMPDNPHLVGQVLEKAHQSIQKAPSERDTLAKKRQAEVAGVGAGGTPRSSSRKSLPSRMKEELEKGGWSEEEIKKIEENLEE